MGALPRTLSYDAYPVTTNTAGAEDAALLRRVAESIDKLDDIQVADITFHFEVTGGEHDLTMTVYYAREPGLGSKVASVDALRESRRSERGRDPARRPVRGSSAGQVGRLDAFGPPASTVAAAGAVVDSARDGRGSA